MINNLGVNTMSGQKVIIQRCGSEFMKKFYFLLKVMLLSPIAAFLQLTCWIS